MPLTKLQFRPGINRDITWYSNEGGWYSCDKIRFKEGYPQPLLGWARLINSTFLGRCRTLHPWVTLNGNKQLAAGTSRKYYIIYNGAYYDITPLRGSATLTSPFTATNGSSDLLVADVAHGALLGDFVTFSGATGLGGNVTAGVLNAQYAITEIVSPDSYRVALSVTANAADAAGSPGGGTVTAAYQLNRDTTNERIWRQDNYGEDLLFNVRDGGIYYWDASAVSPLTQRGVPLSSLPGANTTPTIAKQVLVSDRDRHVIAFGCDDEFSIGTQDPMLIRFSSQESLTDWASTATNTAGSLRLGSGSEIVCAVETRQQTLVFTDTTLYAMQFLGPPFTFGVNAISEGITIISPNAAVAVGDQVFWMGANSFYVYNGGVNTLPCTLNDLVFGESQLNRAKAGLVVAGVNSAHSEVWWFYPSLFSTDNDRYVIYNYEENLWYYGEMRRSAWVDRGIFDYPIAAGWLPNQDSYFYEHEKGFTNGETSPAGAVVSTLTSSPVEIGEGDQYMFLSRILPDVDLTGSLTSGTNRYVEVGLGVVDFPREGSPGLSYQNYYDPNNVSTPPYSGELFYRLRGRMLTFGIRNSVANVFWRLGVPRIDIRTDGRR